MSEPSGEPLVKVENLAFGGDAGGGFRSVSFEVAAGSVVAVVAEPRAAGAALLGCLAGLGRPTGGEAAVLGAPPGEKRERMVFVNGPPRFPFAVKVRELLAQIALLMDDPGGPERAFGALGIAKLGDRYLHELDPEEQQMVRVASSFIGDPDVLLFETLLQNLSPRRAGAVRRAARGLAEKGKAVIFMADEAEALVGFADAVLVLADGEQKAFASPQALMGDQMETLRLEVEAEAPLPLDALRALPFVQEAVEKAAGAVFHLKKDPDNIYAMVDALKAAGARLRALRTVRPSLEAAVLELMAPE